MSITAQKPLLEWTEPRDYERMLSAAVSFPNRIASRASSFAILFVVILLVCCLLVFTHGRQVPFTKLIWLAATLGFLAVFVFAPLENWLSPIKVKFRHDGIARSNGERGEFWNYNEFDGWLISDQSFRGRTVRVLILRFRNGRLVAMGVGSAVNREQIALVFRSVNLQEIPVT